MPILGDGSTVTHAILQDRSKQACNTPTAGDAAKAKALINVMMQDRFFLALYRSNDPKVRAAAMDKPRHKTMMQAEWSSAPLVLSLCPGGK